MSNQSPPTRPAHELRQALLREPSRKRSSSRPRSARRPPARLKNSSRVARRVVTGNRKPTTKLSDMAYNDRGPERRASSIFRMSVEEKAALEAEAAKAGITLQQLFELRILGAIKPAPGPGRRRKPDQNEELHFDMSA